MKVPLITEKSNFLQRFKQFFCKHKSMVDVSRKNYRIGISRVNYYCNDCGIKKLANILH
jgi:hypothetical protein